MHHHQCQQHLSNYHNGFAITVYYIDVVGDTSDAAFLEEIYVTQADDKHDDNHDYDDNPDDEHDIDQVKSIQINENKSD